MISLKECEILHELEGRQRKSHPLMQCVVKNTVSTPKWGGTFSFFFFAKIEFLLVLFLTVMLTK